MMDLYKIAYIDLYSEDIRETNKVLQRCRNASQKAKPFPKKENMNGGVELKGKMMVKFNHPKMKSFPICIMLILICLADTLH